MNSNPASVPAQQSGTRKCKRCKHVKPMVDFTKGHKDYINCNTCRPILAESSRRSRQKAKDLGDSSEEDYEADTEGDSEDGSGDDDSKGGCRGDEDEEDGEEDDKEDGEEDDKEDGKEDEDGESEDGEDQVLRKQCSRCKKWRPLTFSHRAGNPDREYKECNVCEPARTAARLKYEAKKKAIISGPSETESENSEAGDKDLGDEGSTKQESGSHGPGDATTEGELDSQGSREMSLESLESDEKDDDSDQNDGYAGSSKGDTNLSTSEADGDSEGDLTLRLSSVSLSEHDTSNQDDAAEDGAVQMVVNPQISPLENVMTAIINSPDQELAAKCGMVLRFLRLSLLQPGNTALNATDAAWIIDHLAKSRLQITAYHRQVKGDRKPCAVPDPRIHPFLDKFGKLYKTELYLAQQEIEQLDQRPASKLVLIQNFKRVIEELRAHKATIVHLPVGPARIPTSLSGMLPTDIFDRFKRT